MVGTEPDAVDGTDCIRDSEGDLLAKAGIEYPREKVEATKRLFDEFDELD